MVALSQSKPFSVVGASKHGRNVGAVRVLFLASVFLFSCEAKR